MADVEKSIQDLAISVKNIQLQIKELTQQGKSAGEIFNKVKLELSNASKAAELLSSSTRDAFKPAEAKKYLSEVTKINAIFGQLISSYKSVEVAVKKNTEATLAADKSKTSSAKKLQQEYESGFQQLLEGEKRVRKLQEDVSLKNIQLSKKANVDKLQDVVNYYTNLQSEYKEDSEEYLKIEKKKLDAQIKLQKESDSIRLNKKKAAVEQAVKLEKKVESQQKVLRDKIAAQNKARTKEVLTFEKKQAERRASVLASIERKKEKQRTDEVRKGVKERQAAEAKSANRLGSRLKKAVGTLGIYGAAFKIINSVTKVFTELTVGSAKAAIEFQQSLANLGAVAGATNEEVSMLGKEALRTAGATSFTANEIVQLQTELSKLGFSAKDVAESTKSIAFAAQALSSPLGETAALVGKLRNQFSLLVEDTAKIGDTLVTTINNSALSFDSFGTAVQYVGPIAQNLGLTLQQTAGAMAVLADAGFTASRVGTGLRGIFTELGKTSADVEKSLKSLAGQNISLAEAVDLVGKRNAAQLITLLKNIDAVEEGNEKYYEQGRAFISAAKSSSTYSGQLKILNSAFKEFQISTGDFISNSDILLSVMDLFFDKAAETSRAFGILSKLTSEELSESVSQVTNEANSFNVALRILEKQGVLTTAQLIELRDAGEESVLNDAPGFWKRLGSSLGLTFKATQALQNSIQGVQKQLEELSEEELKQQAIIDGTTNANINYEKSVDSIIDSHLKGVNVNKEASQSFKEIGVSVAELEVLREGAEGNDKVRYSAEIARLKALQGQLTNTILSEEQLAERRKAVANKIKNDEKKAVDEEIKRIKKANQEAIDAANEKAKVLTANAITAEEEARIEAERTEVVSKVYKKQASEIRDLSEAYKTQVDRIEEVAEGSDKLARILDSDVIDDVTKAYSDYNKELKDYQEALDDGIMTQETYDATVVGMRANLEKTIETFRSLVGTSPQLEIFFAAMLEDFDAVSTKSQELSTKGEANISKLPKKLNDKLSDAFNEINWGEVIQEAAQTATEALSAFNDVALENAKGEAEQQLDVIKNRYELEGEILKSQLDNQLITESQFRLKKKELRKAQVRDENEIDKALFDAQQKRDRQNATSDYLIALANIIPTLITNDKEANPIALGIKAAITGALATVSYGAELSAISQRKFFPKKFADGGIVNGPSHLEGGVPFSVQGRGGYEMEGGEFVVNKRATSMHKGLLDKINQTGRTSPTIGKMKFAEGGLVSAPVSESVDYLKAIAEATTSTAIGVSKPVRSFITDKDLRSNSTERRIRDRNDRI